MKSLTRWIVVTPEFDISAKDKSYDAVDRLKQIANSTSLVIPRDFVKPNGVSQTEVDEIFVATNETLESSSPNNLQMFLMTMTGSIASDVDSIWRRRDSIRNDLTREIDKNALESTAFERGAAEFQHRRGVQYTPFELNRLKYTLNFGSTTLSIKELFNAIKTTKWTPFVVFDDRADGLVLYKLHNLDIPQSWTDEKVTNGIYMKVVSDKFYTIDSQTHSNVTLNVFKSELVFTLDMRIGSKFIDSESFAKRVFEPFGNVLENTAMYANPRRQEILAISYCAFPNLTINIPVYYELVMNDPTFYALVAIDEFVKASKVKQNVYLHSLRSNDTASLYAKTTLKKNQFGMRFIGEAYVRCRLKTTSVADVVPLQEMISKLFTVYAAKKSDVVDRYRRYIPDFDRRLIGGKKPAAVVKMRKLGPRDIAPDIFLENYSRKCLYRPTIIDDETAENETKSVMRFPVKGESKERNYVCDITTHPYPGLKVNTFPENKLKFPYVPCCYSKDQRLKAGSNYRRYFFGDVAEQKVQHVQEIYNTNKILPPGILGVLPENISSMFATLDGDIGHIYVRKGVSRSYLSSIESILMAKGKAVDNDGLLRHRDRLAVESFAMAAKQEMYYESVGEIIAAIKTSDVKASKFVHALELAFDCDIFLFGDAQNAAGSLIIPSHSMVYRKFVPNRETIFLYEHMGSESDQAEYPQCELIVKTTIDFKNQITGFVPTDAVVKGVNDIFYGMTKSYVLSRELTQPTLTKSLTVTSQIVDNFGKCRIVNVEHDSNVLTLCCDPLPPFAVPRLTSTTRTTVQRTVKFVQSIKGGKILWQRPSRITGRVREIVIDIGFTAVVLCDDTNKVPNVTISSHRSLQFEYLDDRRRDSAVDKFSRNRRTAKLLHAYALYLYSSKQPIALDAFFRDHAVVSRDKKYALDYEFSKFDVSRSTFVENGKLVVPSYETVRRLAFSIALFERNFPNRLKEYKNLEYIPDFYVDVHDYDRTPGQYMIESETGLVQLLSMGKITNYVSEVVRPDARGGYFFKSVIVDANVIFLAQNVYDNGDGNISMAISLATIWIKHGINAYGDDKALKEYQTNVGKDNADDVDIAIYKYVNKDNITRIIDPERIAQFGSLSHSTSVLAYKINGQTRATVLMEL